MTAPANITNKELKERPQTLSLSVEDRITYLANLITDKIIEEQNDSNENIVDNQSCAAQ